MSREIKFRAWAWDTRYPEHERKQYILNVEEIDFEEGSLRLPYKGHKSRDEKLSEVILMQYTGLKDKNGDWYEGDILTGIFKKQGEEKETGAVIQGQIDYDRGSFIWRTWARQLCLNNIWKNEEVDRIEYQWCDVARHVGKDSYWEIVDIHKIGNIHENPELLEGGN